MRAPRLFLVPLLALALALSGCGDDDSSAPTIDGTDEGAEVRITIDDPGWSVATSGFPPETGTVAIGVVNERTEPVELTVFLAPEGHERGAPAPDDATVVLARTVEPGGEETVVDVEISEPGDYAIHVDPLTVGDMERYGTGFTVAAG